MIRRSPFGELIYAYRNRLGLSQAALAAEIARLARSGTSGIESTISERIISLHEAERDDPAEFTVPRVGTVKVYADVFRLREGSAERRAFFAAAEETRRRRRAATEALRQAVEPPIMPDVAIATPPLSPDFVLNGRERQWDRLCAALRAMLRGEPRVAFVQGEAGIGKTRLLTELARRAEWSSADLIVAWGHCFSTAATAPAPPYHALRDVLTLLIGGVQSAGTGQLVSASTAPRLRDRAPQAFEALIEYGPYLIGPVLDTTYTLAQAESLGLADDAWRERFDLVVRTRPAESTQPGRLQEQIAHTLRRIATRGPVVVVIDDLHWAPPETLQALSDVLHTLRESAPVPLLLLGGFRPAEPSNSNRPGPVASMLHETQRVWGDVVVDLAASVGQDEGRSYVDGRVDRLSNRLDQPFREALYKRTAGLPIFVENTLRALIERGQLRLDDAGSLVLAANIHDIDLPASNRAMIGRRLGDLPTRLRTALEIAAVQGEQFFAEPIATILSLDPTEYADLFDTQLGNGWQLLAPGGSLTVAGRRLHRYRFAHSLFKDYLFEELGQIRREQYLAATARALESAAGELPTELAATIADLYDQAGESAAAAAQYKVAAEFDLEQFNPSVAIGHFRRAIALADRQTQGLMIGQSMIGIGHSLRKMGRFDEATVQVQSALSYGRAREMQLVIANATVFLGLLDYDRGENAAAESEILQALPIYQELGKVMEQSQAEGIYAHALYGLGRYDEAIEHADRALAFAMQAGDDALAAESRLAAANCLPDLGLYDEAILRYEHTIELYQRGRDRRGEAICYANIGLCHLNLKRWTPAVTALERAREPAERLGLVRLTPHIYYDFGMVHEGKGDLAAAERAYRRALGLRRKYRQPGYALDPLAGLLRVYTATGRFWRARRLVWGIGRWLAAHGPAGMEEPFRVAESCVVALEALGEDVEAARLVRASAALLHERAAKIASPRHRRAYLENVPSNRALLARAAALDALPKG